MRGPCDGARGPEQLHRPIGLTGLARGLSVPQRSHVAGVEAPLGGTQNPRSVSPRSTEKTRFRVQIKHAVAIGAGKADGLQSVAETGSLACRSAGGPGQGSRACKFVASGLGGLSVMPRRVDLGGVQS